MQPRKDYDDYTSFVNDSFSDTKTNMLKMMTERSGKTERASFTTQGNHIGVL